MTARSEASRSAWSGNLEQGGDVLFAVMRFLSDFLAKTDNRSSTYRRRYWFGRGNERISRLYRAITSSRLYGFFASTLERSVIVCRVGALTHLVRHETTRRISGCNRRKCCYLHGDTYRGVLLAPEKMMSGWKMSHSIITYWHLS